MVPVEMRAGLGISSSNSGHQLLDPVALGSLSSQLECHWVHLHGMPDPKGERDGPVTSLLIPMRSERGNPVSEVVRSHFSPFSSLLRTFWDFVRCF